MDMLCGFYAAFADAWRKTQVRIRYGNKCKTQDQFCMQEPWVNFFSFIIINLNHKKNDSHSSVSRTLC